MIALAIAASFIAMGAAAALGGTSGVIGMSLGLFGTAFNVAALWGVIRLAARSVARQPTSRTGGCLLVLGLFVKLPLLIGMGLFAMKLGGNAPTCFLSGLGLVYAWLTLYALRDGLRKAKLER